MGRITKCIFFLLLLIIIPESTFAVVDIQGGGSGGDVGSVSGYEQGGFHNSKDIGFRMAIYDENGTRVSNSIDIVFSQATNDHLKSHSTPKTTFLKNGNKNGKIDYLKNSNNKPGWEYTTLEDRLIVISNKSTSILEEDGIPSSFLKENALAIYKNWSKYNKDDIDKIKGKLKVCKKNVYTCDKNKYFAVFEPTMYVYANNVPYYGTAYELAYTLMDSAKSTKMKNGATMLYNHVNDALPRTLSIKGAEDNRDFYEQIGIKEYCKNVRNCFGFNGTTAMTKESILTKGVGMSVFDWTQNMDDVTEERSCKSSINIKECGESTITEESDKDCIIDNAAYLFLKSCNIYCSNKIETDFSGLYNTFIGKNKFNAIESGKYIKIKNNPKIIITKTCYQSGAPNDCSNAADAFKQKLVSTYKTNEIKLNIDKNKYKYNLIGIPKITSDGIKSATITYEYKLNATVNRYIDKETLKAISDINNINKNRIIDNGGPTIITKKASGSSEYSLDVGDTVLANYVSGSTYLKNFTHNSSNKYNFTNDITTEYIKSDNSKSNRINLKYECKYTKYNSDKGCICEQNECCNSVTCESVSCSPPTDPPGGGDPGGGDPGGGDPCKCNSECGCYNDGKCTPIPCPDSDCDPTKENCSDGDDDNDCDPTKENCSDGDDDNDCDPTKENCSDGDDDNDCDPEKETCFPDLVYRPISLTDPFPGIKGNGRTPGANWNQVVKINGKYVNLVDYYIKNNRGYKDYEVYQKEPLYVIKLDARTIKNIRKYNKKKKYNYNDFDLDCLNGEKCTSNFLRDTFPNLIDSGACKNINNHNFDSCIKRAK